MTTFFLSTTLPSSETEILALYDAVGWTTYTKDPQVLMEALAGSSFITCAWSGQGRLIGLARAISDDASICYLQDILVHPDFQGTGVGKALFTKVAERFEHVRQTVLITDDEPQQRAFYEAMGLTEGADIKPSPVRTFVKFR